MKSELEILNQDMVAMTNELQKHIEQEANKIKSSHSLIISDLKKKEEECKNVIIIIITVRFICFMSVLHIVNRRGSFSTDHYL